MAVQLPLDENVFADRADGEPAFMVDVDGFEGPLDLLLELARRQKVDLHRISVLELAEQYLAFIEAARRVRLELAADYLVMAAWLAFLKSRLLLPEPAGDDQPDAAELATALAHRLRQLEAIRAAAGRLISRPRLGRDFFARGKPEPIELVKTQRWAASLYDLLKAYAQQRQIHALSRVTLPKRMVWSLAEARETLERLIGFVVEWTALDECLLEYCVTPVMRRTVRASAFSASLEMVREGRLELRQDRAFSAIWIRAAARDSSTSRKYAQGNS